MKQNNEKIWLSTKDVANKYNLNHETLKKQRQRKIGLPYFKFGGTIRYNDLEIKQYLENQTCKKK